MNSRKRHIAKAITWRVVASTTTFILTLIFFKDDPDATQKATGVALIEATLKMVFYYYHERIWFRTKLRIRSKVRHLLKTITWRVIASLTTFTVAFIVFNKDPHAIEKASGIALIETFLKMLLYYLHERAWHTQRFGLGEEEKKNQ